jgi:hypothetical protein
MIKLKGFPTQISEEIPIPDMAELLTYPFFFDTDIEDAYRYGTDFQKKLLDSIPNLGESGKKTISVLSEVRFLGPKYRSCTGSFDDHDIEWHIDCEENEDGSHIFTEERDIVHLYTNQTSSMTEFLEEELIVPNSQETMDYARFHQFFVESIRSGSISPKTKPMPANKIVTFTNHMHRASDPKQYEFKYMFRVVETNRMRPPSRYNPEVNASRVTNPDNNVVTNIIRNNDVITIYIPTGFTSQEPLRGRVENNTTDPYVQSINVEPEIFTEFKTMKVDALGWESELTASDSVLKKFSPLNSIMLLIKGNFSSPEKNEALLSFFANISKDVKLVDPQGETISGRFSNDFYDLDSQLGYIAGCHIVFVFREFNKIKPGVEYKIEVDKLNGYFYEIPEDMKFVLRLPKLV